MTSDARNSTRCPCTTSNPNPEPDPDPNHSPSPNPNPDPNSNLDPDPNPDPSPDPKPHQVPVHNVFLKQEASRHGQSATPLAVPQLGSCACSGRAWWLRAAQHSQEKARPLGAPPPPRVLERSASKAADFTA
eukprot:scaffold102748_cov45-Phaeocystis_antarctica.AAC.1